MFHFSSNARNGPGVNKNLLVYFQRVPHVRCRFTIYTLFMDIHKSFLDFQKSSWIKDIHKSFKDIH